VSSVTLSELEIEYEIVLSAALDTLFDSDSDRELLSVEDNDNSKIVLISSVYELVLLVTIP